MKILVVEDNEKNMAAAKAVAGEFSEHEFRFTNSAKEASEILDGFDAVITDLFFPNEGHGDGGMLGAAYALYQSMVAIESPAFEQVVWSYYRGERGRANEELANAIAFMEDGTIRRAVARLISLWEGWGKSEEEISKYSKVLENLPVSQYPYGGALMLQAEGSSKRHCLVSDIHRHAGDYKDAPGAIDGMVLLLPLMEADIISVEQARLDGRDSLTYLGCDEIRRFGKVKTDPAVWAEAIRRVLAQ